MRVSVVVGTAGHIDHGKSALVRALTGTDPDRLKEEQERGITIDLGFAHAAIGDVDAAFVDVPGHERFVRNMLAGAGGIDAVLLVIAADESVMPQTREHFEICRLLGLTHGLIVLTKSDLADPDTLAIARDDASALVRGSFLAGAPIVPVSVRTGDGLDALRAAIATMAQQIPARAVDGVARLPVDRVFSVKGFGTVVTGTLVAGRIADGDALAIEPQGRPVRVRGVQVHGRPVETAMAPRRVAVNLGGVDVADVARGATLAPAGALPVTRRIDVRVELLPADRPLRHGARVRVHQGTSEIAARLVVCAWRAPGEHWRQAAPGEPAVAIPPGADAYVRLRLEERAVLTRGDRLVLRALSPAVTIGGGRVLDPLPPTGALRRPAALARFRALDAEGDTQAAQGVGSETAGVAAAAVFLGDAGARGITDAELAARAGVSITRADEVLAQLAATGNATRSHGRAFDAVALGRIADRVVATLAAFHAASPRDTGMPRESVRERAAPAASLALFDAVTDGLVAAGTVVGVERLALASHRSPVSAAEEETSEALVRRLLEAGLQPPDAMALSEALQMPLTDVERALLTLVRERRLLRLGTLVFHPDPLTQLKADVRSLPATTGVKTVDVGAFKTRFGLSRKYAIPLLEWLDRERVTRRVGESRVVL